MGKFTNETELTLNNNSFADLTFKQFHGLQVKKIHVNAFGESSNSITFFTCLKCEIQNHQPDYNIWATLSRLTQINQLIIGLNVSEIPSNAFRSVDGLEPLNLGKITFQILKNVTIYSGAFKNLNKLKQIIFYRTNISIFKKESLGFNTKSTQDLVIQFAYCNFSDDPFESDAFNRLQRSVQIIFWRSNINYLSESAFKSVLNNSSNEILFYNPYILDKVYSRIDCQNCKNLWLLKEGTENQVKHAYCKQNPEKRLFDFEIKNELISKCKSNIN